MKPVPSAASVRRHLRVPPAARNTSRVRLAALVAALVVGILGMHGLASHGVPDATTDTAAGAAHTSSVSSMSGMASDEDAAIAIPDSHEGHAPSVATSAGGLGHDMGSMVMLCVVMLAAAALTLLVVLVAGLFRPLSPVAFMPATVGERAVQWVRGTGPPHEWQFSVIRC